LIERYLGEDYLGNITRKSSVFCAACN